MSAALTNEQTKTPFLSVVGALRRLTRITGIHFQPNILPLHERMTVKQILKERCQAFTEATAVLANLDHSEQNGPIRMYIALRMLRAFSGFNGSAYSRTLY